MAQDEDLTADADVRERALVLYGRIPLLAEFAERLAALPALEDHQTTLEGYSALNAGLRELLAWVEESGDAARAELDQVRKGIGMPSEFH